MCSKTGLRESSNAVPEICGPSGASLGRMEGADSCALCRLAADLDWSDDELKHAISAKKEPLEPVEIVLDLKNGKQLRCPGAPMECTYIRLTQAGHELGRWSSKDLTEQPSDAMGMIFWVASRTKQRPRLHK